MITNRRADLGSFVLTAQQLLEDAGFDPGAIDGSFGPVTEAAVRAFQAARDLVVDGVIGPQTWEVLRQDRDEPDWKERALAAEAELERIRNGIRALIGA